MERKSRWLIGVVVVIALVLLGPPITRTIKFASSADGLLLLASFHDDDFDWNPWSADCYLIRQDTAVWLLSNFDWPYDRRSGLFFEYAPQPLISGALGWRGMSGADAFGQIADDRMLHLMGVFIDKGESLEERWQGYTPLQAAILQEDLQAVKSLVDHGANLNALVERPEKAMHGMNGFEFVEFLYSKHPERFDAIRQYLRQHDNFD